MDQTTPGEPPPEEPEPTIAASMEPQSGEMIGPYRLLERIGVGGMGEVYLAQQQEPIRRQVALKVIKLGMDTKAVVARFESERQALAMMDHPCIAKVLDAGATQYGRPYFVMEYVQGVPITEHCDRHRLTTRQRLELFQQVCEGVQHAHQKAIIHRDLKASNVLVTVQGDRATPKIIDFGVAKATARPLTEVTAHTELGQIVGTPEYMSPEQAEMTGQNIDTRTDIYSLGVLLYVLLVGALPFEPRELREASFDELRRRIREDDPPRPSTRVSSLGQTSSLAARNRHTESATLIRQLRGDLDWIILKALEKDRTRRYGSPMEMAADIQRHLEDQPVLARSPSTSYRVRKFVQRHRVGVGAVATVAVVLVAFAVTMAIQAGRIAQERDRANHEAAAVQEVAGFLTDLFRVSDPGEGRGNTITAREILDEGAAKITRTLTGQPEVQARLMDTMGEVYANLGLYDPAWSLMENASQIWGELHEGNHPDVATSLRLRASLLYRRGDYQEAERVARQSLAMDRKILGDQHAKTAESLQQLAMSLKAQARFDEAEDYYRQALAIRRALPVKRLDDTASNLTSLGELLRAKGELDEAETLHREALAIARRLHGDVHPTISYSLNNLALVLQAKEEYEEAEAYARDVVALDREMYGEDSLLLTTGLNNLAALLKTKGNLDEAEALHRRALAIRQEALGPNHPDVAASLNNLSVTLQAKGELAAAAALQREALRIVRQTKGDDHPHVGVSLYNLGRLCFRGKDFAGAEEALDQAAPIMSKTLADDNWRMGYLRSMRGYCLAELGRYAEAESLVVGGYETILAARGGEDPRTVAALDLVVRMYEKAGRTDQAGSYRARQK